MKSLNDQLSSYAAYHRDPRNIATHFAGIPMIVLGTAALLARPTPYLMAAALAASCAFYLALDRRYGVAMTALMSLAGWAGVAIASLSTAAWLSASLGVFVIGWAIQFVGHAFEGRKPAFADDLLGLLLGPLFIVAEAGFALGLRDDLRREIERRAGPIARRIARAAI